MGLPRYDTAAMPKPYHHLTVDERDLIAVLRGEGETLREIARRLSRDPSTLSRELRRNAPPVHRGYYLPHRAHGRAVIRNRASRRHPRLRAPRLRAYVRQRIRAGWSPELTAGRWSTLHPAQTVSHEAIYQWIYTDERALIPFLVRAHKKRLRRGYSPEAPEHPHSKPYFHHGASQGGHTENHCWALGSRYGRLSTEHGGAPGGD